MVSYLQVKAQKNTRTAIVSGERLARVPTKLYMSSGSLIEMWADSTNDLYVFDDSLIGCKILTVRSIFLKKTNRRTIFK